MNTERIITIGTQIWNSLTEDEQDHIIVYDGTLGFVENLLSLLGQDITDNLAQTVHNQIFFTLD